MTFERIVLGDSPFPNPVPYPTHFFNEISPWPARWIASPWLEEPLVTVYRLFFVMENAGVLRIHVSGDERYELLCDGLPVGRGPERGVPQNWAFETYDLTLEARSHLFVARVWTLGRGPAPPAQQRVQSGFLLAADDVAMRDQISTGFAAWQVKRLTDYAFLPKGPCFGTSGFESLGPAAGDTSWRMGQGEGWQTALPGEEPVNTGGVYRGSQRHRMRPSQLPPMLAGRYERGRVRVVQVLAASEPNEVPVKEGGDCLPWEAWWQEGAPLTIDPNTRLRVLIDLEDYVCAYVELLTEGGSGGSVRWHWEEALYHKRERDRSSKGQRDGVDGKYFDGFGDQFRPAGTCHFSTLWWRCGRYIELVIETSEEPLTMKAGRLYETRYPYKWGRSLTSHDTRMMRALPILERGLAMCAHETFMDCPYYEQLMYVGDTRLQALTMLATSTDSRLIRKALRDGDSSRWPDGMISSNFSPGGQMIPTFGLMWVAMLHDYLWWRDDRPLLDELLSGARAILDWWLKRKGADGLLVSPSEWSFMDWVASPTGCQENHPWHTGMPPGGEPGGVSYLLNWQVVCALGTLRDLERAAGEAERGAVWEMEATRLAAVLETASWDSDRELYRDEPSGRWYSQHGQILPMLSGRIDSRRARKLSRALDEQADLTQATLYFSHYLLEAYYQTDNAEAFDRRLEEWRLMPERGFKTPYEIRWEKTRSDCHAWGSHPLFHLHASVLGVRPVEMGFRTVRIRPLMPMNGWATGSLPHPAGEVSVSLQRTAEGWRGTIKLPDGVRGEWRPEGGATVDFTGELDVSQHFEQPIQVV